MAPFPDLDHVPILTSPLRPPSHPGHSAGRPRRWCQAPGPRPRRAGARGTAGGGGLCPRGGGYPPQRAPFRGGLVVGDTLRCPWHHASFSLRPGEPVRPPALNPVACWVVERRGETVV